jgi:hypothetical protein
MPKAKFPLLINLFAGPSAGKTTAALELTAALKKKGYNVEYVSEYAKELVLENKLDLLKNQEFVTEEQFKRLDRLRNSGVEIIVTDSPVLLGKIYGKGTLSEEYDKKISEYHNSFDNFNLFVKRGETFQTEGRIHNLEQSQAIDSEIIAMLRENNVFFGNYHHDEIDKTVDKINTTFTRLYGEKQLTESQPTKPGAKRTAAVPVADWKQTSIGDLEIAKKYEKSTLFRLPIGGDYAGYCIMFPNSLVKKNYELLYKEDFSFVLKNNGEEKTLTGEQFEEELKKIAAFPKYENSRNYLKNCPPTLRGENKFVCLRLTWNEEKGKFAKMPINPKTGGQAQVNNPETWGSFEEATAALENFRIKGGIGYILTGSDNIVGIDLDLDPKTHKLTEAGEKILNKLKGKTYIEYSASGAVHIFGFGKKPGEAARGIDSSLEMYGSSEAGNRSLMLTGNIYGKEVAPICNIQKEIDEIYNTYFKRPEQVRTVVPERASTLDERTIIGKLQNASNAAKFNALMSGDTSMHGGDYSKADLALCTLIAFYTHDKSVIDGIYRRSGLYSAEKTNPTTGRLESRAEKWVSLHGDKTYGEYTIDMAINNCTKAYQEKNPDNVLEKVEPLRILRETDKAVLVKYQSPEDATQKLTEWLPKSKCKIETDSNDRQSVVAVSKGFIAEKHIPLLRVNPLIKK